ncbi:hypothetical protein AGABI2DRAFT_187156 [Agaricus bisporus var. bisporus H97]|uniref:hypothetical protein n=1 Tax=Agaricus bisporus var. bisporus (strain H97 / ATCC MYA-4626 / FGSC 10389) TaxID=936046 RepID=UPI00029F72F7|nr:hypothetical protein AGABI2DRAFT_187156 [Agaricus bisporus var. bisporus H97]EKV45472.1 hypothetical protein AGABI2DRAFT_187156 [Agaricus bisporus var. bisporus H97]
MNQSMDNETTPRSRPRTHSMIYATPSGRLLYKNSSLTASAKERVDRANAPFNQRRCLVQNLPNDYSVQYCHMIARKYTRDEDLMTLLEWYWNMRYRELHLNTRHNIFFAGAALHLHHDNNAWGLLPDKEYVDQYYEKRFVDRNEFPKIPLPEGGFKYKLIPLGDSMKTFPILRQNEHGQPPSVDQYTIYLYPFDNMPTFRTHLHPKFAIYELGRKVHTLVAKDGAAVTRAFRTYRDLEHVYDVFASWSLSQKNSARFEEWKNQDNTEGDGDGQSESSSKTGADSWRNGVKRKRIEHADEQGMEETTSLGVDAARQHLDELDDSDHHWQTQNFSSAILASTRDCSRGCALRHLNINNITQRLGTQFLNNR